MQRKLASLGGQDLRKPLMGGTKLPTDDSKGAAKKRLNASSAEVGPIMPFPKYGEPMDPVSTDPLVIFLRKEAMALDDNESAMPKGDEVKPLSSEDPLPTAYMTDKVNSHIYSPTDILFNSGKTTAKMYDKDYKPDVGAVDRVLSTKSRA